MPDTTDTTRQLEDLHTEAARARRGASEARQLALAIERRREAVIRRDDAALARHTPDVWTSQAATASRIELSRGVGLSLWLASESLRETRIALEQQAHRLDGDASSYRRQADLVAAEARVDVAAE